MLNIEYWFNSISWITTKNLNSLNKSHIIDDASNEHDQLDSNAHERYKNYRKKKEHRNARVNIQYYYLENRRWSVASAQLKLKHQSDNIDYCIIWFTACMHNTSYIKQALINLLGLFYLKREEKTRKIEWNPQLRFVDARHPVSVINQSRWQWFIEWI